MAAPRGAWRPRLQPLFPSVGNSTASERVELKLSCGQGPLGFSSTSLPAQTMSSSLKRTSSSQVSGMTTPSFPAASTRPSSSSPRTSTTNSGSLPSMRLAAATPAFRLSATGPVGRVSTQRKPLGIPQTAGCRGKVVWVKWTVHRWRSPPAGHPLCRRPCDGHCALGRGGISFQPEGKAFDGIAAKMPLGTPAFLWQYLAFSSGSTSSSSSLHPGKQQIMLTQVLGFLLPM